MINTYFSSFFNFASQVVIIIRIIHFCQRVEQVINQPTKPNTDREKENDVANQPRQIGKENDVIFLAYIRTSVTMKKKGWNNKENERGEIIYF